MKYDVITSGYVSLDRIIRIQSPLKVGFTSIVENRDNSQTYFGGCSTNIAYLLARLGLKTLPMVRFGDDHRETGFIEFLRAGGVSLDAVEVVEGESTSNCYLVSGRDNDHVTIFYPGAMDNKYARSMDAKYFKHARLAVLTVGSPSDNLEFYQRCKEANLPLVFGMKCDFHAFPKDLFKELLYYSKIIFTNEHERQEIENIFALDSITDFLEKGNAKVIVTTLGAKGSVCYHKTQDGVSVEEVLSAKVARVVDTTGTGDAFISGFLYGYLRGYKIKACAELGSVLASFIIEETGSCTNSPAEATLLTRYEHFLKGE